MASKCPKPFPKPCSDKWVFSLYIPLELYGIQKSPKTCHQSPCDGVLMMYGLPFPHPTSLELEKVK